MQKPLINFFIIFICITLSLDSFGQSDQEILLKDSSSDQIEFVLEKPDRKFIQKINPFYWAYTGMTILV